SGSEQALRPVTVVARPTRSVAHDRAGTRQPRSREVGYVSLLRDRTPIGCTAEEGRACQRHYGSGRAHLAAPDLRRANPLRFLDYRALVLPGLEGEERSRRGATPQAAH